MFVMVDIGRPDRFWHLIPVIGRFNWPISMLAWDVIVLNGYLLLNLHITTYLLYHQFRGQAARAGRSTSRSSSWRSSGRSASTR